MTPSNPTNSQPLIYRIADKLGVFHLVACINHTHEQSEVEGLQSALLSKADASSTDTKINGKISRVPTATNGNIAEFDDDGNIKDSGKKTSDFMLAMTVDSTPTADSANLVTSGGVAAALEGKMDKMTVDSTPTADSANLVTSGGVKGALSQKADKRLIDNTVSGAGRAFIQLGTDDETEIYVEMQVAKNGVTENADITVDNIPNLQRALQTPDSTPTANSDKLVTSGGVKAALDVQKRINNRQLQLTKTADGYQFVNSESDLPTFVNMIKSWGGEGDYVCANCIVITDGDAVAMPAIFNWVETSLYITIRAYIGCYLLEGDIRKNGSSYSSDMMMQLEDRSYVFSE